MPTPPSQLTPDKSARHLFGHVLREHRETARMSQDELSRIIPWSKASIARVEKAQQIIPDGMATALDAAFGTRQFSDLYLLARKEAHPDWVRQRMEFEARAIAIAEYSPQLMPGLLQTEEYARAVFSIGNPKATAEEIDDLVAARMARQSLLTSSTPPMHALIVDEAVLRRIVAGTEVMRSQLARLADYADTATSTVQVVPYEQGAHELMGGSLALFTLDSGLQVAWEEGITTGTLLEDTDSVRALQWRYDRLRSSTWSPARSAELILSVMEALPV